MLTVFLNERRRRKLLVGSSGMHPGEMFLDWCSLGSPFLGFSVIQSGYWPDFNLESFFANQCGSMPAISMSLHLSAPPAGAQLRTTVSRSGFYKKQSFCRALFFVMFNLLLFPIGCFLDQLLLINRNTLEQVGVFRCNIIQWNDKYLLYTNLVYFTLRAEATFSRYELACEKQPLPTTVQIRPEIWTNK